MKYEESIDEKLERIALYVERMHAKKSTLLGCSFLNWCRQRDLLLAKNYNFLLRSMLL